MRANRSQRGFTLLELMTVVAVMGILAAVVIPAFAREMRKGRYDAEVNAVIAELQQKEYMYKEDTGRWKPVALCPSTPKDSGYNVDTACMTTGSDWSTLKVDPRVKTLRCTYQVSTGCKTDTAQAPSGASFNQGVETWMFIVATCGTGTDSYTYFASSTNPSIQKLSGTKTYTASSNVACTTQIASTGGTGSSGSSGSSGAAGASGSSGASGATGSTGSSSTSTSGSSGAAGASGSSGAAGASGTSSASGSSGAAGASGSTGTGSTGTTTTTTTADSGGNGNSTVKNGNNTHDNCNGAGNCTTSVGHTK